MSNVLVRGIPPRLHREIQRWAETENLSVNQLFIKLALEAVEARKKTDQEDEEKKDVFERIKELREEIYRRNGIMEDSTKLIREDRDR